MSFKEEKEGLRKEIKKRFGIYTKEELAEYSLAAIRNLENIPEFLKAKTILLYWSLEDEVLTQAFIKKWYQKKNILLPVILNDEMSAYLYEGENKLIKGAFDIMQPISSKYTETVDLAVIPGRAFDAKGHRLGRGKGFYDRYLKSIDTYKIGLCFHFQIQDYVPFEEFDVVMDKVISD